MDDADLGQGPLLVKVNIKSTYRIIPVDRPLGMVWDGEHLGRSCHSGSTIRKSSK